MSWVMALMSALSITDCGIVAMATSENHRRYQDRACASRASLPRGAEPMKERTVVRSYDFCNEKY
jgi:hypothetical protein